MFKFNLHEDMTNVLWFLWTPSLYDRIDGTSDGVGLLDVYVHNTAMDENMSLGMNFFPSKISAIKDINDINLKWHILISNSSVLALCISII